MATTTVDANKIGFYVRTYGSTDAFKRIVCEENLTLEISNDVNTTKTKCGVFKGIDVADFKANGTGVCNITPTASEISHEDLVTIQLANTKLEFVLQNEAYTEGVTTYALGEVIRMQGGCYITSTQLQANQGDKMKFTWAIEGDGTLDDTES